MSLRGDVAFTRLSRGRVDGVEATWHRADAVAPDRLPHATRRLSWDHDDAVEASHRRRRADHVKFKVTEDAESAPADVDVDVVREERVQHIQARFERLRLLGLRARWSPFRGWVVPAGQAARPPTVQ